MSYNRRPQPARIRGMSYISPLPTSPPSNACSNSPEDNSIVNSSSASRWRSPTPIGGPEEQVRALYRSNNQHNEYKETHTQQSSTVFRLHRSASTSRRDSKHCQDIGIYWHSNDLEGRDRSTSETLVPVKQMMWSRTDFVKSADGWRGNRDRGEAKQMLNGTKNGVVRRQYSLRDSGPFLSDEEIQRFRSSLHAHFFVKDAVRDKITKDKIRDVTVAGTVSDSSNDSSDTSANSTPSSNETNTASTTPTTASTLRSSPTSDPKPSEQRLPNQRRPFATPKTTARSYLQETKGNSSYSHHTVNRTVDRFRDVLPVASSRKSTGPPQLPELHFNDSHPALVGEHPAHNSPPRSPNVDKKAETQPNLTTLHKISSPPLVGNGLPPGPNKPCQPLEKKSKASPIITHSPNAPEHGTMPTRLGPIRSFKAMPYDCMAMSDSCPPPPPPPLPTCSNPMVERTGYVGSLPVTRSQDIQVLPLGSISADNKNHDAAGRPGSRCNERPFWRKFKVPNETGEDSPKEHANLESRARCVNTASPSLESLASSTEEKATPAESDNLGEKRVDPTLTAKKGSSEPSRSSSSASEQESATVARKSEEKTVIKKVNSQKAIEDAEKSERKRIADPTRERADSQKRGENYSVIHNASLDSRPAFAPMPNQPSRMSPTTATTTTKTKQMSTDMEKCADRTDGNNSKVYDNDKQKQRRWWAMLPCCRDRRL